MKDSKGSIRDALQAIRESQSEVVLERINFHGKSPAERKGSEFDRKSEINGYKKILKAIEKINKDHEKFQYNNRADGPSNIFKGLQQVERTCYDLIREIEQGKWDGAVDLEEQVISEAYWVMTKAGEDTWKIVKSFDDIEDAKKAKEDIWVQSGKMSDKAIISSTTATEKGWKMNGIVTWDGKGRI